MVIDYDITRTGSRVQLFSYTNFSGHKYKETKDHVLTKKLITNNMELLMDLYVIHGDRETFSKENGQKLLSSTEYRIEIRGITRSRKLEHYKSNNKST